MHPASPAAIEPLAKLLTHLGQALGLSMAYVDLAGQWVTAEGWPARCANPACDAPEACTCLAAFARTAGATPAGTRACDFGRQPLAAEVRLAGAPAGWLLSEPLDQAAATQASPADTEALLCLAVESVGHVLARRELEATLARLELQRLELEDSVRARTQALEHINASLAEREAVLKQILDTSSVGIFLVDLEGRITQANGRMAEMFGTPLERLEGSEYVSLIHPDERDVGRQKMLALLASRIESVDLDRRYWRADQSEFWGRLTGNRFYDTQGRERGLVGVIADISERKLMEEQLRESESRFRQIFINNDNVFLMIDPASGAIIDANPAASRFYGYTVEQMTSMAIDQINTLPPDEIAAERARAAAHQRNYFVFPHRLADGRIRSVEVHSSPVSVGGRELLFSIVLDVTERREAEAKLQQAASVFTTSQEGIMITDADSRIIDVNPAFTTITGYPREEVLGHNPRILASGRQPAEFYAEMYQALNERGSWQGELWNRCRDGSLIAERLLIDAVRDSEGRLIRYVAVFSDISQQKAHQAELDRIAHYDVLTGVPNRRLLGDRLVQAVERAARSGRALAICYCDLDGFKPVNDRFGHAGGDALLVEIAGRLTEVLRGSDTLARLGGDEFVLLISDVEGPAAVRAVLDRVLEAVARPAVIDGAQVAVSASIGVTVYPADDSDPDTLLRHADQAMYCAKEDGKNRYHLYDPSYDRENFARRTQLQRLAEALAAQEFVLHYQPKVDLLTGEVVGAEALIRWQHPEDGLLPPGAFLPHIYGSELEVALGDWVIDRVMAQIEAWNAEGLEMRLSANVSATHLLSPDFSARLRAMLARHPGVAPGQLELEILETASLSDLDQAAQVLTHCLAHGVRFSIDDFGTGYSSLTYFQRLPVDTLKIDRSFVLGMLDDPSDLGIVESVVRLAGAFNRPVIAEGVETAEHGDVLVQLGCRFAQGFGIARPMPAGALPGWIEDWRTRAPRRNPMESPESGADLALMVVGRHLDSWVGALARHLAEPARHDVPDLPDIERRFSRWFHGNGTARYGVRAEYQAIERQHQLIHQHAAAVHEALNHGNAAATEAAFAQLHAARHRMHELLGELRAQKSPQAGRHG